MPKYRSPLSHGPGGSRGIGGGSSERRKPLPPPAPKVRIPVHGRAAEQRRADRAAKQPEPRGRVYGRARERRTQDRERKYVRALDRQANAASSRETAYQQARTYRLSGGSAARRDHGGGGGIFDSIGHAASDAASSASGSASKALGLVGSTIASGNSLSPKPLRDLEKRASDLLGTKVGSTTGPVDLPSSVSQLQGGGAQRKDYTVGDVVNAAALVAPELSAGRLAAEGATAKTAKNVTESAAQKAASAAEKVKARPRPIKAAKAKVAATKPAQAASRAKGKVNRAATQAKAKVAEKTPQPVKTTAKAANKASKPVRYPFKVAKKHPVVTTALSVEGPGAVGAATSKDHNVGAHLTAPVVGTAKALLHPGETGAATLHATEGGLISTLGLGANAGLTLGRGASTLAHGAGIPGARGYTDKEITAPTTSSVKALTDFAKQYADVYGSGDAKKIEEATKHEFGIGMLLPLIGAGRHGAVRRARALEHPEEGVAAHLPGVGKKIVERRKNKAVSRHVARGNRAAAVEGMALADATDKALGVSGRKKHVKGGAEDIAAAVLKEGATKPEHIHEAAKARGGARHPHAAPGTVTIHDASQMLKDNPKLWDDPKVQEALAVTREVQPGIHTSDIKVLESARITAGIKHPWEREGWKKNPKTAEQKATNAKIEAETNAETQAWLDKTGRVAPVYVKSVDARTPHVNQNVNSVPRGTVGRASHKMDHRSEAKLNSSGLEDLSYPSLKVHSFFEPRAKREINANTAAFWENNAQEFSVKRGKGGTSKVVTQKERDQIVREMQARGEDPNKIIWLDSQTGKAAVMDRHAGEMIEIPMGEESVRQAFENLGVDRKAKKAKGPAFIGVDRTLGEQFLAQHGRLTESAMQKIGQGLLPTQRLASKALLGYSPSWLLAQPVAEGIQALAAVGPIQMYKGLKRYKEASPEGKRRFDAGIGATAGTGSVYEALTDVRANKQGKGAVPNAVKQVRTGLGKSRPGRVVEGILSGRYANAIDRKKGLAIRRAVAAGHLEREYNGFTGALKNLLTEQDHLDREMRNLTPVQRIEWAGKNAKQMARAEGYVDDVMGNWSALTTNERALSGVLIFYPFVRMSMEWTALSYPARHPLKAAALQFLGQNNAQQVERYLGGKPSFLSSWATVPLYAGTGKNTGKATSLLPLQRIGVGSNAIVEGLGGDQSPRNFLRAANPVVAAAAAAFGGYDPSTGRSQLNKFESVSPAQFGKSLASQLGSLPSVGRLLDTNTVPLPGLDKITGKDVLKGLSGKKDTPTSKKFDSLSNHDILHSVVPLLPLNTSSERSKAELGRLISRSHAGDNVDYDTVLANALKAAKSASGGKVKDAAIKDQIVTALDALVAHNRLNEALGTTTSPDRIKQIAEAGHIPYKQAQSLVYSQSGSYPHYKTWNEILTDAKAAGISIRSLKTLRRARARSLMGND